MIAVGYPLLGEGLAGSCPFASKMYTSIWYTMTSGSEGEFFDSLSLAFNRLPVLLNSVALWWATILGCCPGAVQGLF